MLELTAEEARVAGSLAEKSLATPQHYPLTANALLAACNQSNNRDPVVTYDAAAVEAAMAGLRSKGAARVIHAGGGNRTMKYRHVLDEALGLDARELALVCVLLLRGPQTLNELRTRTERMASFDDPSDVERDLGRLADREEPLVVRIERRPGQKEARYATLLVARPADEAPATAPSTATASAPTALPQALVGEAMDELDAAGGVSDDTWSALASVLPAADLARLAMRLVRTSARQDLRRLLEEGADGATP